MRRVRKLWLLPALLFFIPACVQAPSRKPLQADLVPPARWDTEAAPGEPVAEWWALFEDAALDSLIRTALERNHDLAAAAARLDQAAAQARIAGANLQPQVSAGASASRQRQVFVGLPIPGSSGVLSTHSTQYGVSVATTWEADLWGRLRAGARAAVADLEAVRADLRGAHLSLAAQTAKAWFAVIEARQQRDLARRTADSFRRTAEQVRARYHRGVRPAVELRLALSTLATAEASLRQREAVLDPAARQLEVLLGRYPTDRWTENSASELPAVPGPVPAGLPAGLIARRPDLAAAERRLAASDQRVKLARRSLYPRFSLTASGGSSSNELGDLLDGDFRVWSLLGNLSAPIFQGGRLRAEVRRSMAVAEESLSLYAGRALQAYAEVESALAREEHLAGQETHLAESTRQLSAARLLAEERYRSGVGDYLTVLESQTREFAAQSNLLAVKRLRLDNRIDLHLALGGGFEEDRS